MDRTGSFTLCQLRYVLGQIDLSGFESLQFVSDAATHFRSNTVLASYAHRLLEDCGDKRDLRARVPIKKTNVADSFQSCVKHYGKQR